MTSSPRPDPRPAAHSLAGMVNNDLYADITLVGFDQKRVVRIPFPPIPDLVPSQPLAPHPPHLVQAAHSYIVTVRCPKLLSGVLESKEGGVWVATESCLGSEVLLLLLFYLYTGSLAGYARHVSLRDLLKGLRTTQILELPHLREELQRRVWEALRPKKPFRVLRQAAELGVLPQVRPLVVTYVMQNWSAVDEKRAESQSYESVASEVPELASPPSPAQLAEAQGGLVSLLELAGPYATPHYTQDERWRGDMKQVLKRMEGADFKIVSEAQKEEGACHRALLAAHSRPLADLVARSQSNEYFSALSAPAIEALLSWLYFGARTNDAEVAAKLLQFAYAFHLPGLVLQCEKTLRKNISRETVLFILQVSLHPEARGTSDRRLQLECLDFIVKNLEALDLTPLRTMAPSVAAQIILVLQGAVGTHWAIGEVPTPAPEEPEEGEEGDATPSGLIRTLSGTHIDRVPPKVAPSFSKGGRKQGVAKDRPPEEEQSSLPQPASPKPEVRDEQRPSPLPAQEEEDSDSFNLDRILPPPSAADDGMDLKTRTGSAQSGLKLQKKKRKKVANKQDLDDLFS